MKWALVDSQNKVVNIIVYEPSSGYVAPEGFRVQQVEDWIEIDKTVDAAKPIPIQKDKNMVKLKRNADYASDLRFVGMFELAKISNPALVFSDYLDDLETKLIQLELAERGKLPVSISAGEEAISVQ